MKKYTFRKFALPLVLTLVFSLLNLISYTNSSSPPRALTNAPSEGNCTSCHTGSALVTSGNSWKNITLTANTNSTLEYFPDSNFHMELLANISGITKYGFEITALDSTKGKSIGTFTITNSTATGKGSSVVGGSSRDYVYQKSAGTAAQNGNTITWDFDWKAPAALSGPIKFYVVVNATNSNGNDNGDVIYAKVFTMRPSALLPKVKMSSNATTLCQGDTLFCNTKATNVKSYAWKIYNGAAVVATDTGAAPHFVMNNAGTFKVKVTGVNDKGSSEDSITVKVNTKPTISIAAKGVTKICNTDSVSLTATATTGSSLTWSNGATTSGIYIRQSGLYHCTANLSGCITQSNSVQVEVAPQLPKPIISCGNSSLSSITWNWQSVTGAIGYEVSEDNGSSWMQPSSGTTGQSHVRNGLSANTQYTLWVRAKDSLPCGNSNFDSITCITSNCVPVLYTVKFDSTRCAGVNDTIQFNIIGTSKFAIKFNNIYSSSTQFIVNATKDSVYNFEIIDSSQLACTPAKVSIPVKIDQVNISVNIPATGACAGVAQTFTAVPGFTRYIFRDLNNNILQDAATHLYITADSGELKGIKVTAFNAAGCSNDAVSGAATIFPIPVPVFSFNITPGSKMVTFNAPSAAGVKSEWIFGDGQTDTTGNKTPSHTYTTGGKFKVTLRETQNGCTGDTTLEIDLGNVGIQPGYPDAVLQAFPNPFGEELYLSGLFDHPGIVRAELLNIQGQVEIIIPENQINKNNQVVFATASIPAGVYIIKITASDGHQAFYRVVKQ